MVNNKCRCGKLKPLALGLAMGILTGIMMMLLAWWGWYSGSASIMAMIQQWSSIYPGLDTTVIGGIFGAAWGFLEGLISGFLLAWLYNICSCCSSSSCCCKPSKS